MLRRCTFALAAAALAGCSTLPVGSSATPTQSAAKFDACLMKAYAINEGDWSYTGSIAFGDGTFDTFQTRTNSRSDGSNAWIVTNSGGDAEGRAPTRVTYLGDGVIEYTSMSEDGETDRETYTLCEGPDDQGRYKTTSTYDFMLQSIGKEATVTTSGVTNANGSYFTEVFEAKDGSGILGYRSGILVPVSSR